MSAIPAVYFDLTPPRLVTALITEQGVLRPREIRPLSTPFCLTCLGTPQKRWRWRHHML